MNVQSIASNKLLLLSPREWLIAISAGGLLAISLFPFYWSISLMIGLALLVAGVTIIHLHYSAIYVVPFPHLLILISILQYVIAPWVSIFFPSDNPVYNIGGRLPAYLMYAVPAILMLVGGFAATLVRLAPAAGVPAKTESSLLWELDCLIVIGFASLIAPKLIRYESLTFLWVLLGNLRFVGLFGRMLVQGRGWRLRFVLVLSTEVLFATRDTMFHGLILWALWSVGIWLYCRRPRLRAVLAALLIGLLVLPALQESKWQLRAGSQPEERAGLAESSDDVSSLEQAFTWVQYFWSGLWKTIALEFDDDFVADVIVRYNQGWIIDRVMVVVPDFEPYARGETLKNAVVAALLPRVFAPEKAKAGGQNAMEQFAALEVTEFTSMNLGYAGEMYANFGFWGGLLGSFIYGAFFGLIYRLIAVRAFHLPLWWFALPYIFYSALKAEDGVAEVLNWAVKSCFVFGIIAFAFPAIRSALFPSSRKPDRPAFSPRIRTSPRNV